MPADLLAGCRGTGWNPKDPVALGTDYRCCSEGTWRDQVEPHGRGVGLLITQREAGWRAAFAARQRGQSSPRTGLTLGSSWEPSPPGASLVVLTGRATRVP
jgi:hypothetical protein